MASLGWQLNWCLVLLLWDGELRYSRLLLLLSIDELFLEQERVQDEALILLVTSRSHGASRVSVHRLADLGTVRDYLK